MANDISRQFIFDQQSKLSFVIIQNIQKRLLMLR